MPGKRIVVPSRFLYRQLQVYTTVTRYCNNPGAKWGYFTVLSSFHGDWKIRAQPLNADDTGMQEPATASATVDSPQRSRPDPPSLKRPETGDSKIHTQPPVPGDADAQEPGDTSVTATICRRYVRNPPFPWHPSHGHPEIPAQPPNPGDTNAQEPTDASATTTTRRRYEHKPRSP